MVDSQCLIKTIKLSVVDMRTRTDLKHFGRCMSHQCRARFLYLARSKFRLCSANHRLGYRSNLSCDWSSTAATYSEQETENRLRFRVGSTNMFGLNYGVCIFEHASTPIHVRFVTYMAPGTHTNHFWFVVKGTLWIKRAWIKTHNVSISIIHHSKICKTLAFFNQALIWSIRKLGLPTNHDIHV